MDEIPTPIKKTSLLNWVNQQIKQGAPRWPLYHRLSKLQSETKDVDEMVLLMEVMSSIEDELVNRNQKGIELENRGKEDKAIALYEANVADRFDGSHPYERLRIIYSKRKKNEDIKRICQAYIDYGQPDEKLKSIYSQLIKSLS